MRHWKRVANPARSAARTALRRGWSGALLAALIAATAYAHESSAGVGGRWHVVIPGWGIEDHLLVIEERDGAIAGKFEFADVKGTVTGAQLRFDVTDAAGALVLRFEGTVAGETMNGTTTSPKDGPLAHLADRHRLTTEWTAKREAHAH